MLKAFGAAMRTRQIAAALTRVTDITPNPPPTVSSSGALWVAEITAA
jgi:predicted aconitase